MKYTVMTGNPVDGFRALGIFDSNEEAIDYGSIDSAMIGDWTVMQIDEVAEQKLTRAQMIDRLIDWNFQKYSTHLDEELLREVKEKNLI